MDARETRRAREYLDLVVQAEVVHGEFPEGSAEEDELLDRADTIWWTLSPEEITWVQRERLFEQARARARRA